MEIPGEITSKFPEYPLEIVAYIYYLHDKIDKLEARVTELESRLHLNSNNRGKPPSSDGYARKHRVTSLPVKTQKNLVVNLVTKKKLWKRVLILIILKLILLTSVLVVKVVFRVEHYFSLKNARYLTFLLLRQLKLLKIDLKPWFVPMVDAKHPTIILVILGYHDRAHIRQMSIIKYIIVNYITKI